MPMPKIHMAKHLPGERIIAKCWQQRVHEAMITENESAVECKKCLKAIAFDRECEADWQRRKAREGGAR